MDIETKQYRASELSKLAVYIEYQPNIRIVSPNGVTNYLAITNDELIQIAKVLGVELKESHLGQWEGTAL